MKKLLVISLLLSLLTACGDSTKTTTKKYKRELLEKVYNKDQKAQMEYKNILKELEIEIDKGSEKAEKEFEEWKDIEGDFIFKNMRKMSPEGKAAAEAFKNKKGKGW